MTLEQVLRLALFRGMALVLFGVVVPKNVLVAFNEGTRAAYSKARNGAAHRIKPEPLNTAPWTGVHS